MDQVSPNATEAPTKSKFKDLSDEEKELGVIAGIVVPWGDSRTVMLRTKEGRYFAGTWTCDDAEHARNQARNRALANLRTWRQNCTSPARRAS